MRNIRVRTATLAVILATSSLAGLRPSAMAASAGKVPDPCLSSTASEATLLACKPGQDRSLQPFGPATGRHGQEFNYEGIRNGHIPEPGSTANDPLVQALHQQSSLSVQGGSWSGIGPAPITYPMSTSTNSGRVLALAYQQSTGAIFLGSADGGVWKSTNQGSSWTPLTDSMPSLAIQSLAIDPNNSQTIFAGTGEQAWCGDCLYGVGIYKSTDSGSTWTLYGNSLFHGNVVSSIVVDPTNSNNVYAAVAAHGGQNTGVAVSTDGGQSWAIPSGTLLTGKSVSQLVADNAGNLYAAVSGSNSANGVYLSTDHGQSWTAVSTGLPGGSDQVRIALDPNTAGSAQGAQILFAILSDNSQSNFGKILGIYRTTNGGGSWTRIGAPTAANSYEDQGWYDIYIAADPRDTSGNTVYFGLTAIYRTTNALSSSPTWVDDTCGQPSCNYGTAIHPDQHAVLFAGSSTYFGNDGGIYSSANGAAPFNPINGNLALTQFYGGAAGGTTSSPRLIAGSQDNGTIQRDGGPWQDVVGGDGMLTAIDPGSPNAMYGEWEYGDTFSTTDGSNWNETRNGLDMNERALWSAPLVMDPNHSQTLYSARTHLYRTTDGEANWSNISPGVSTNGPIAAVAVARTDSNVIYMADQSGNMWKTTDGGTTWTALLGSSCDASHPDPKNCGSGGPTAIAVDPTNSQIVYVSENAFEGAQQYHLFKSTDGGSTWNDISTSLPDEPFQTVAVSPTSPSVVYAAADIGVYVSTDGGSTWSVLGSGLPNVSVYEIVPSSDGSLVYAFTHGRGAWQIASVSATPSAPTSLAVTPSSGQLTVTWGPPNSGLGIDSYSVAITDGHAFSQSQSITDLTNLSATFTGLTNGTTYTITVRAHNAGGLGTPGTIAGVPAGVPGKPTGLHAMAGNGQLSFSWTAPTNGGSAITSSTVSCTPGPVTGTITGTGTSLTIGNLQNGTPYTCTVTASNAVGAGAASDPVTATPFTVPGQVQSLGLAVGNGQLVASWSPPASNGGAAIDRYDVKVFKSGSSSPAPGAQIGPVSCVATCSASVTGLTNLTTYVVNVQAHNAAGDGPVASASGAPNAPPAITLSTSQASVPYGGKVSFIAGASDPDKEHVSLTIVPGSGPGGCALQGGTGTSRNTILCGGAPSGLVMGPLSTNLTTHAVSTTISGQVGLAAGTYGITFAASDGPTTVTQTFTLRVSPAGAIVTGSTTNPLAAIDTPATGTLSTLVIKGIAKPATGTPSSIARLGTMIFTLTPYAGSLGAPAVCTTGGQVKTSELDGTCSFTNVPIGVYIVTVSVSSGYYVGSSSTALTVYDPHSGALAGAGALKHGTFPAEMAFLAQGGSGTPTGAMVYIEHHAATNGVITDVVETSTSLTGLTVNTTAKTATLTGTSMVGSMSGYGFTLTASAAGTHGAVALRTVDSSNRQYGTLTFTSTSLLTGKVVLPAPSMS